MRVRHLAFLVACLTLPGCASEPAGETSDTGPVEPGARLTANGCAGGSATLVATRVGCANPGPCTLAMNPFKTFEATCGSGADVTVVIEQAGRYALEVREGSNASCWATTANATSVTVSNDDVDMAAEITLIEAMASACPEP